MQVTLDQRRAQHRLAYAVSTLAYKEIADTRIRYRAQHDAPDTWEALQAWDLGKGYLPVWNGGSEHSVYGSEVVNYLFRYWHDMGHLFYGLGFTPAEERALQEYHIPEVEAIVGKGSLAAQMYRADTLGQIKYLERHGEFPDNQAGFVLEYIENPSRALGLSYPVAA